VTRIVPDARHLPELDHAMLQEMAESGAKVVCAQAVEWARRANIAIYARSTFDAEEEGARQTVVRKFGPSEHLRARAVVGEGNVALGSFTDPAQLDPLLRLAGSAKVPLKDVSVTERGASFVVPLLNVPDWHAAKQRLLGAFPSLAFVEDVALVSVVGDGLAATTEPLLRFLGALRATATTPFAVTATPLRLSAVIAASASAEVQRVLHRGFIDAD
jgi:aspartate kinase